MNRLTGLLRRDGFDGQHMLVLPEPVWSKSRKHPLLRGLYLTDAGYFPVAKNHFVERPMGAPTTLVILCLRGAGRVSSGKENYIISGGDWVWLPANEVHSYESDDADPWTIAWAHFGGEEVAGWRELLGAEKATASFVHSLPDDRLDEIALDQVYAALERGYGLRQQIAAAAALRHALSTVAELAIASRDVRSTSERMIASIDGLRRDWVRPHRLEELATAVGISVTHYSALFRKYTGYAPIDFLIRLRVQHACRLLDTTKLSVGEVADRIGYQDAYYFTRCFRRVMGCSPRAYRKVPKG